MVFLRICVFGCVAFVAAILVLRVVAPPTVEASEPAYAVLDERTRADVRTRLAVADEPEGEPRNAHDYAHALILASGGPRFTPLLDGYAAWAIREPRAADIYAQARSGSIECIEPRRLSWHSSAGISEREDALRHAWSALPFIVAEHRGGAEAAREVYRSFGWAMWSTGHWSVLIERTCEKLAAESRAGR